MKRSGGSISIPKKFSIVPFPFLVCLFTQPSALCTTPPTALTHDGKQLYSVETCDYEDEIIIIIIITSLTRIELLLHALTGGSRGIYFYSRVKLYLDFSSVIISLEYPVDVPVEPERISSLGTCRNVPGISAEYDVPTGLQRV